VTAMLALLIVLVIVPVLVGGPRLGRPIAAR
jgi:hypothetical protein